MPAPRRTAAPPSSLAARARAALRTWGAVVAALVALAVVVRATHQAALARRAGVKEVDAHLLLPEPRLARILSLGYTELTADLAWVRALVYYGDGLIHRTGMPDLERIIDLIYALDPGFRRPYVWGAYAVTYRDEVATPEEFEASVRILRRGVERFPDDWELAWLLGLRLFLDVKRSDPEEQRRLREEGVTYLERAMRLPDAPGDLPLLAAAMRTKLGQRERALRELREMILVTEDADAREALMARYAGLASQDASEELEAAQRALEEEWRRHMPYAPPSLYVIVGPPLAPGWDLRALAGGETFADDEALAAPGRDGAEDAPGAKGGAPGAPPLAPDAADAAGGAAPGAPRR